VDLIHLARLGVHAAVNGNELCGSIRVRKFLDLLSDF
jgi:hypothetical protein